MFQTTCIDNTFSKRFCRVSETVKRETSTAENLSEICSTTTEGPSPDWLSEVFSQQWTPDLQNQSTHVESSPYDAELKEVEKILLPEVYIHFFLINFILGNIAKKVPPKRHPPLPKLGQKLCDF